MSDDKKDILKQAFLQKIFAKRPVQRSYYPFAWYVKAYRLLVKLNMLLSFIILIMLLSAYVVIFDKPEKAFYATTYDGDLVRIYPKNHPLFNSRPPEK